MVKESDIRIERSSSIWHGKLNILNPYVSVFILFLFSRIAILAIAIFCQQIQDFRVEDEHLLGTVHLLHINLGTSLEHLGKADVVWYQSIMDKGYEILPFESTRQHNWAFFPLWPMVWWCFEQVIPHRMLAGIVAAHAFFLLGLINLYRIAIALGLSRRLANTSILFLCFFPVSYFFSFPFTESLFLFLVTGFFDRCIRGRWIAAGIFGALASATRPTGILLACIPLLYLGFTFIQDRKKIRSWKPLATCSILTSAGLASFMVYLYTITGNAFAFKDIQVAWYRKNEFFIITVLKYLKKLPLVVDNWDFRLLNLGSFFLCIFLAIFLWKVSRKLPWQIWAKTFTIFILLSLIMPINTGSLQALSRYTLVIFPVFIALSILVERRRDLYAPIAIASALLLGIMVTFYSFGFAFALA